jgi:serine phosphatase RsbU (regulator of sigma subunit)
MIRIIALLIFSCNITLCFSQVPGFSINHYSPKDYGTGREAANWACVQDMTGMLYFGNAGGVLRFDGSVWSFIPVKNQSLWIKGLAVSNESVVYAGARGEFGYLNPGKTGKLSYVSLSDRLSGEIPLSDINRIWTAGSRVIFQYEEALFIWSDGSLKTILPETSFHVSFLINDELFIRQRGMGIMKLTNDDNLQLVKGSGVLKDIGIFSMMESPDREKYLIVTHKDGLWSLDKNTFSCDQITTTDNSFFRQADVYGAIRLNDGRIAVNTLSDGIIITDETFKTVTTVNKKSGLKVNSVLAIMQDYQSNIWACLDNGIAQIHYSSPVSFYVPETGIEGNVNDIRRYNGDLFIASTGGLFILNSSSRSLSDAFIPFEGITKEVRSLCPAEGCLLLNTRDELLEIRKDRISKIENNEISSLHYSDKLKILFVSGKRCLSLYKYSGKWHKIKDIPEITEEIVKFEESAGSDFVTLWMGTRISGAVRLQLTDATDYKVDKYDSADGLAHETWVLPLSIGNKIFFSQNNGLLTFIDEKTIQDQLPDSLKNRPEFYKGYFEFSGISGSADIIKSPLYLAEDTKERVYVNLDGDPGYFDKRNDYSFVKEPFALTYIGKINAILHEDTGVCWFGGDEGILRYDENSVKDYRLGFRTLITKVTCGADSVISYGYHPRIKDDRENPGQIEKYMIRYGLNTLTFEFAAPFFEGREKMLYSYMLEGQDTAYSLWNKENRIVFSKLREGDYTFVVKAKNVYGHTGQEDSFSFTVLTPWFRTIWAYILYFAVIISFIYAGILINTRRLTAMNKKLEKTIGERTQEIHDKNVKLESQKKEILDSINYAHRIQNAVLPNDDLMREWLGDHFIVFRPKDIVSGDFYWAASFDHYTVFCVADCTGHGVPGAFMSMLCITYLNEIVLKEKIIHPEIVLDIIRKMVIESLKQKGEMWEQKDGMDIAICFYDRHTSVIEFSGANNPLFIIREKEKEPLPFAKQIENDNFMLYEIKGERMPVSFSDRMEPFIRHTFRAQENDRLYLFSDGICDQFGGPHGKRFMHNSLRKTLLESITPEIRNQKVHIENRIDEWQAYINPKTSLTYEQIDDICLMGVKI